jgi:hypothetical protein
MECVLLQPAGPPEKISSPPSLEGTYLCCQPCQELIILHFVSNHFHDLNSRKFNLDTRLLRKSFGNRQDTSLGTTKRTKHHPRSTRPAQHRGCRSSTRSAATPPPVAAVPAARQKESWWEEKEWREGVGEGGRDSEEGRDGGREGWREGCSHPHGASHPSPAHGPHRRWRQAGRILRTGSHLRSGPQVWGARVTRQKAVAFRGPNDARRCAHWRTAPCSTAPPRAAGPRRPPPLSLLITPLPPRPPARGGKFVLCNIQLVMQAVSLSENRGTKISLWSSLVASQRMAKEDDSHNKFGVDGQMDSEVCTLFFFVIFWPECLAMISTNVCLLLNPVKALTGSEIHIAENFLKKKNNYHY